ncbi:hypothetical protein GY45DRAFT_553475 [Cubamyces sp. BRFM 1775]|nr:hypothetical protein GY45DRAFT_553475 [Cubamyces sp. BRFM 1775]
MSILFTTKNNSSSSLNREPVDDEPEPEPAPVNAPPAPVPAAVRPNTPPRPRAPPPDPVSPVSRSPLRDLSPHASEAEAGPSGAPRKTLHEHDDDAGQPRRRKRPSRVGRSPSLEPPPREAVVQSSRYFSRNAAGANGTAGASNGAASAGLDDEDAGRVRVDSGDANAMHNLKRAIGLSPPRAAPANIPDGGSEEEVEDFFNPTTRASSKGKGKEKAELSFGEAGSEDYPFDFEMDDSFLEQISRVEHEAYLRQEPSPKANGKSPMLLQPQPPPQPVAQQVKAEPRSQSTTRTFLNTTSTAVGARRSAASSRAASAAPLEVIDISDDEVEGDKENVPAPTRHVRRRVAPVVEDVIELSD